MQSLQPFLDSLDTAAIAVILSFVFISLPMILYCGIQLRRSWHELYLIKRRRSIIVALYVLISLCTAKQCIYATRDLFPDSIRRVHISVSGAMDTFLQWTIASLIITRVWLLSYDYNYESVLAASSWKIMLSPNTIENDWFLLHRHQWGDGCFIQKCIIIPFTTLRGILYGVSYNLSLYSFTVDIVASFVFAVFCVFFVGKLWSKYPQFQDPYFMRHELRMVFIFMTLGTVILTSIWSLYIFVGCSWLWTYMMMQYLLSLLLYLMIVYPKRKVLNENEDIISEQMGRTKSLNTDDMRFSIRNRWEKQIATKQGYEAFANHLVEQMSVEVY